MHRDPENKEKQVIAKLLGPSAGDLFEIGCGDGRLTRELADLFGTLTALDPEFPAEIEADIFVSGQTKFLAGSGEDLPLVDNCADTVIFFPLPSPPGPYKGPGRSPTSPEEKRPNPGPGAGGALTPDHVVRRISR